MRFLLAAAVGLMLPSRARAQMRIETAAPEIASFGGAPAATKFAPMPLSASAPTFAAPALVPSLPAASAPAGAIAPAAAPAPGFAAAAAPALRAPESAREPAASSWAPPKSAEGAAWRYHASWFLGRRLWDGTRSASELASGSMGTVFAHPSESGSVVKIARKGYAERYRNLGMDVPDDETALDIEDHALARLAEIGASPRPLARLTISGRPASKRERIVGNTVEELYDEGLVGPFERSLVRDLIDLIGRHGFFARDLNLGNIMLGRREGDANVRAWLVDTLRLAEADVADAAVRTAGMRQALAPYGIEWNEPSAPRVEAAPTPAQAHRSETTEPPRDWDFGRWSLPRSDEGSAWRFSDRWFVGARLRDGSRSAEELGAGAMGTVFVHPSRSDSVIKVARRGYAEMSGQHMAPDDETVLDYEDFDLARLAALGAAPRPLARLTISGRPASERERIYGKTVWSLKRAGLFGPRERALVQDLLERVSRGGFVAHDLNLSNIMIGRRGGDAQERAWLVDALGVSTREDLDDEGRIAAMLASPVPWISFQGFGLSQPLGRALGDRGRK